MPDKPGKLNLKFSMICKKVIACPRFLTSAVWSTLVQHYEKSVMYDVHQSM